MSWQKGFPKYSSELSPSSMKAGTAGFVESCGSEAGLMLVLSIRREDWVHMDSKCGRIIVIPLTSTS
jgi:hypothetical protein